MGPKPHPPVSPAHRVRHDDGQDDQECDQEHLPPLRYHASSPVSRTRRDRMLVISLLVASDASYTASDSCT